MTPEDSADELRAFLRRRSVRLDPAALPELVEAVLDFYRTVPAIGLSDDAQSDMLLFQFGTYDWGQGANFEFDITRQFIIADEDDDDAISQLRCTVLYKPTLVLKSAGEANLWCKSKAEVATFRQAILDSPAYAMAEREPSHDVQITWSGV